MSVCGVLRSNRFFIPFCGLIQDSMSVEICPVCFIFFNFLLKLVSEQNQKHSPKHIFVLFSGDVASNFFIKAIYYFKSVYNKAIKIK